MRNTKYYNEIQNYIRYAKLGAVFTFWGEQDIDSVFSIMRMSDLFVLTSLREGFPNALMEAMSLCLPVISSDVSDIKYLIREGVNGFLFLPNDANKLAELITKIYYMDANDRTQMGICGRRIIEENYTIDKMVTKIGT